jgi:hypothetical protein
MLKQETEESFLNLPALRKGSLVKTKILSPNGLHRAEVKDVVVRDGVKFAIGVNWEFPETDLIVIRPPIKERDPRL